MGRGVYVDVGFCLMSSKIEREREKEKDRERERERERESGRD